MRDKRPVDELSIEELERILTIRKREERQRQLARMKRSGRIVGNGDSVQPVPTQTVPIPVPAASAETQAPAPKANPPATAAPKFSSPAAPRFEDDPGEDIGLAKTAEKDRVWRTFVNRALLLVEVVAVIGLVVIGVTMFTAIGKLEDETASAQAAADEVRRAGIPTIAPTPELRLEQIVLPGGHKPPSEGLLFNYDEIPSHLLPVVQNQIHPPIIRRPEPTDQTALRLIIPKLDIDQTIVQGVDWDALKQGVGQLQNGVNPSDEHGNLVLAAHNDIYSEIFRYLDKLEPGDQFQVQTATKIYQYTITSSDIVAPDAVHVMDSGSTPTATLISCYPYQVNTERIVVFAERVGT